MASSKSYDLTIIGSGPGGYVAAVRAAQLGMSVLLVEKDAELGGVCTLRGCIPTKALPHTADLLTEARRGAEVGVRTSGVELDWPAAMAYKSRGLTEAKARERGTDVRVGRFPFSASGKARILGQTAGFVKIVAEPKRGIVLGVHMIGPRVTEMLSEVATAMRLEITAIDLVRTVHAHPTLAEAVHEAAEAVLGAPIHV